MSTAQARPQILVHIQGDIATVNGKLLPPSDDGPHHAAVTYIAQRYAEPLHRPVKVTAVSDQDEPTRFVTHPDGTTTDIEANGTILRPSAATRPHRRYLPLLIVIAVGLVILALTAVITLYLLNQLGGSADALAPHLLSKEHLA